jgi:hypothetical protein
MAVRKRLATLALVVSAAACGGSSKNQSPHVSAPLDTSVPPVLIAGSAMFAPGEYLEFEVKWKGLAGGSTQIIAGEPGVENGRRALVIRSITTTEGIVAVFKRMREELTTVIDIDSGAPISSQNAVEEGRDLRRIDVAFGDRAYLLEHAPPDDPRETWKQAIPDDGPWAHDLHSILAHLRAWDPPLGTRGYAFVQSARTFFRFDVVAAGRERVETDAGTFEATRYEGIGKALDKKGAPTGLTREMKFWISTGDLRIPVKLLSETEYGDVYAVLTEHRPGSSTIRATAPTSPPRGRSERPSGTPPAPTASAPSTR